MITSMDIDLETVADKLDPVVAHFSTRHYARHWAATVAANLTAEAAPVLSRDVALTDDRATAIRLAAAITLLQHRLHDPALLERILLVKNSRRAEPWAGVVGGRLGGARVGRGRLRIGSRSDRPAATDRAGARGTY